MTPERRTMETITGNVDLEGIKRFQIPDAIVIITCPQCGIIAPIQLVDQIYYPSEHPEGGHSVAYECEKCDIIIERKVKIVSVIATFDVGDAEIS